MEDMPHGLTKRHLPHDYHATSDSEGRRTLPLQWASPEGTFTWGEILTGAVALTYMWLQDAEVHTQAPDAHHLLALEGEAAIKNVHTADGGGLRTGERRHRGVITRPPTHHTPHHGTRVPPRAPDHCAPAHRDRHARRPTGMDGQVGTRVRLSARWAAQALPHQSHPRAGPHHGRIPHRGGPPHRGLDLHAHLHREAAEALKTAISNHQGLVHTPDDNTQKGYTLWWHHPAPEGGLQPSADQPGIRPDLTAVAHAVAAMAQQVGALPQWAPSVIKEAAARHNPAFAHFRGFPIHPPLLDLDLPAHDAWVVHILVLATSRPKLGTRQHASPNSSRIPHSTTTYQRPTSSSPTTRAATTTTYTPRMSAPPSPYTPSPPTLASSHHNTSRLQRGSIHYTSPRPRAKGPPTTHPLQPTAPPSTHPADGLRHTIKTTRSRASALDPAPSPKSPIKAP